MRYVIFPYGDKSRSAKKLAFGLSEAGYNSAIATGETNYRPRSTDVIVGWGSGEWPNWKRSAIASGAIWLNQSDVVQRSVYKDRTFSHLRAHRVPIPEISYSYEQGLAWIREGHIVIARNNLEGRDGQGITIAQRAADLPTNCLYSKYFPVQEEYRVHVFQGVPFWCQIRHPIEDTDNKYYTTRPNKFVRTSSHGWTLYVSNRDCPNVCKQVAVRAIQAVGLDFGAVDIGYGVDGDVCVYETNTSPELSDRTCGAYVEVLLRFSNGEETD